MIQIFCQLLYLIFTYMVCSIPFGLILSKIFANQDIRQSGSGNIGATNVARVLGKKLGFATLLLDSLKGAVMVTAGRFLFSDSSGLNIFLVLVAIFAVVGHIYPIYLKFKGGKGVATSIAVILAINPFIGVVCYGLWIAVFVITKTSALASILSLFLTIFVAIFSSSLKEEVFLYLFLFLIVTFHHKENIKRILAGKENKFIN